MSLRQFPPLHTGEEMQQISNLAHIIEGIVIGIAAIVMMAESRRLLRGQGGRYAWAVLLFGAGTSCSGISWFRTTDSTWRELSGTGFSATRNSDSTCCCRR